MLLIFQLNLTYNNLYFLWFWVEAYFGPKLGINIYIFFLLTLKKNKKNKQKKWLNYHEDNVFMQNKTLNDDEICLLLYKQNNVLKNIK